MAFRAAALLSLLSQALGARNYLHFPNSDVWSVNETLFPASALRNASALAALCDATPSCIGFNLNGWLKNGSTSLAPAVVDAYLLAPSPAPPAPTLLWPQPQLAQLGAGRLLVSSRLSFTTGTPCVELADAFARASALIFSQGAYDDSAAAAQLGLPTLTELQVSVADACATPLDVGVSEAYNLTLPSDDTAGLLAAPTVWGALQGLSTLTQLIRFAPEQLAYWAPAPVAIQDAPKFPYRGIMVDPARAFLPPAVLRAIIDSLTHVKLNVLHVHILDCDSFPIQVGVPYDALWEGAFSPRERYTAQQLAALTEYGRQRGVVVIYEFDQPGHMGAMCKGLPSVCPTPSCDPAYGGDVLDPSSPDTIPAMQAIVSALAAASQSSSILHLGGDEVNPACWLASPAVRAWMAAHNCSSGDDIYRYFVMQSNAMAVAAGKSPMRWEEVWRHFGTSLHPSTIVHAWLSSQSLFEAASAGYRSVFSVNKEAYYLDFLDVQWDRVYATDPLRGLTNASSLPFILGAQMCMWGETVDASTVLSVIWPRAAAAAERLWSYNFATAGAQDWDTVQRFSQLRCLLLERGVPAGVTGAANAGDMRPAWTVGSCGGGFAKLC